MNPNNEALTLIHDLAEALDNMILHNGKPMSAEDKYQRTMLVATARQSLRNCGYYAEPVITKP